MRSVRWVLSVFLLFVSLVATSSCGGDSPDQKGAEYRFDSTGRLESVITPDRSRIRYRWNAAGYLNEMRYRGGRVLYGYDPAGMLAWVEDRKGSVEYYRDALGRVTDVLWRRPFTRLVRYEHDANDRIVGISIHDVGRAVGGGAAPANLHITDNRPSGEESWRKRREQVFALSDWLSKAGRFTEYRARYEYDTSGRMIAVEGPGGRVTYSHAVGPGTIERRWPNGMTSVQTRDPQGRVLSVEHKSAAGVTLAAFEYHWSEVGELTTVVESGTGGDLRVALRWQDGRLAGVETAGDRPAVVRYDENGQISSATSGSRAIQFGYDALGQLRRSGDASWDVNVNGWVKSLSVKGRTLSVDYDGRGFPATFGDEGATVASEFDPSGHLSRVRVDGDERRFLPDPVTDADAPLLAWDGTGQVVTSQLYGEELLLELDAGGRARYFLSDGLGAVRLVVDGDGKVQAGASPWPGVADVASARVARAATRQRGPRLPTLVATAHAADEDESATSWGLRNVDAASDWARFLTEEQYFRRAGFQSDEVQGFLYNDKIQNRYAQFLAATNKPSVDVYLKGISNGWAETTIDSRGRCAAGDCVFLPTFGALPNALHLPATVVEKFGRLTRKLDMPALIEAARKAGKSLNSIVCESGCGFELERNVGALERYARMNPAVRLPVIVVQSTDIGVLLRARLSSAGYPIALVTEDGIVPRVVASSADYAGVLGRLPIVGERLGLPVQLVSSIGFVGKQLITGRPIVGPHGVDAHWDAIQLPLDAHRLPWRALRDQTPEELADRFPRGSPPAPIRDRVSDPLPQLERKLGGIALAPRAEAEIDVGSIAGLARDRNGVALLLGRRKVGVPSLHLADLAVALRLAYGTPPLYPQFSLDPADPANPQGEWLKLVHLPDSVAGSGFGHTMFLADWIMKQLSFGLLVDPGGAVSRRAVMPAGLKDVFALTFARPGRQSGEEVWTRLWIVARDFRWKIAADAVSFTSARLGVNARRQVVDPRSKTGLSDVDAAVDPASAQFAADFTLKYDAVAESIPEFARLTELAKLVALAHWMRDRGIPVDSEWLRRQTIPARNDIERVSALSDTRGDVQQTSSRTAGVVTVSTHTRTLRMFGGVDLTVMPKPDGDAGMLADAFNGHFDDDRSPRQFPVFAEGEPLVATVLPVNERGRAIWKTSRGADVDGVKREYAEDGALSRVTNPDGSSVDYQYSAGRAVEAIERVAGRPVATHHLDVNGRVERSDYSDGGRVEYRYGADNTLTRVAYTAGSGERSTWETGSNGTTGTVTLPGYESVTQRFGADGILDEIAVGGPRAARSSVRPSAVPETPAFPQRNIPVPTARLTDGVPTSNQTSGAVQARRKRPNWVTRLFGVRGQRFELVSRPTGTRVEPSDPGDARRADEVRTLSTAESVLMHVGRSSSMDGFVQVQFGSEQLTLPRADVDAFLEGGRAPMELETLIRRQTDVTRLLILDSAEASVGGGRSSPVDTVRLVRALNREYGHEMSVQLAMDATTGVVNAAAIPVVTGPKDVAAFLARDSFGVTDNGLADIVHKPLQASGIDIVESPRIIESGNVIVISAHNDAQFARLLETLGEGQVLKEKYVLLCSCGAPADTATNSRLIREHGATAVHFFPEEINVQAAGDVLVQLGKELNKPSQRGRTLEQLLRDAVDGVLRSKPLQRLIDEIDKLRRGITQVSDLGFGPGVPQHA